MADSIITEEEIVDALLRSGYLIESRLINILSDKGYMTFPNETYPDPVTGKSREIDLYAQSYRTVGSLSLNTSLLIDINHSLVVECANNPQPAVFFRRTEKNKFTIFGKYRYNKIEQAIVEDESENGADFEFLTFTVESEDFHYNKIDRSSQYCSFTIKKNNNAGGKREWLASHPDSLHDTFNKIYDCIKNKEEYTKEWLETHRKYDVYAVMTYPVIVLQGDIYEAYEEGGNVKLTKVNHVVFEFNRYEDSSSSLLIDIVTESYFEEYLQLLRDDMEKLKDLYTNYYTGKTLKYPRPKPVFKPKE